MKQYILIAVLIIFSLTPVCLSPEPIIEKSGNITFTPNIIQNVSFAYSDFGFVFSYKTFSLRINIFALYDGQSISFKSFMPQITKLGTKYEVISERNAKAIHYGYRLNSIPNAISTKLDAVGFEFVNSSFPNTEFELETDMTDEGYNLTRLFVPKLGLTFSFEDLLKLGFTADFVGKTKVLVRNVANKTNLLIDPITYSAPIITVVGYSAVTPCTFYDVWYQSNASGWGVVTNTLNTQYAFSAKLYIGNGTSAGTTYFTDQKKEITFATGIVTAGNEYLIYVRSYATFTLGTVVNATTKNVKDGLCIINLESTYLTYLIYGQGSLATTNLYGVTLVSETRAHLRNLYGNMWYINLLGKVRVALGSVNMYKATFTYMTPADTLLSTIAGTFDEIVISNSTYGLGIWGRVGDPQTNVSNIVIQDCTYDFYVWLLTQYDAYLTNVNSNWIFYFTGGDSTKRIYRRYEYDLKISFENGTAMEGANVTLYNNEIALGSWLTSSDGTIPLQSINIGYYNQTGGNTIYTYEPLHVIISFDGYQTVEYNFTLTQKSTHIIAMVTSVTSNPDYYFYLFVIGLIMLIISILLCTNTKH